jgi:APA family basic amino acid/polyamine antiporter
MALSAGLIGLSRGNISEIATISVFAIFMVYAAVNLSLIWLRYKQPTLERPYRSPIRIGWFPVLAGLGLVTSLAMLTQFDATAMAFGAAAVASGLASHFAMAKYGRRHPRDGKA